MFKIYSFSYGSSNFSVNSIGTLYFYQIVLKFKKKIIEMNYLY